MSDNPSIRERLTSIETSLKILIKINNEDHKEMKEIFNNLNKRVNDEVTVMRSRLVKIEQNAVASKTELGIYKKVLIFLLGVLTMGISSCFFSVILPKLLGV